MTGERHRPDRNAIVFSDRVAATGGGITISAPSLHPVEAVGEDSDPDSTAAWCRSGSIASC
jgi:hypothetical protein